MKHKYRIIFFLLGIAGALALALGIDPSALLTGLIYRLRDLVSTLIGVFCILIERKNQKKEKKKLKRNNNYFIKINDKIYKNFTNGLSYAKVFL